MKISSPSEIVLNLFNEFQGSFISLGKSASSVFYSDFLYKLSGTNMDDLTLGKKAVAAKSKSLPTYSNFHVGAALLTKDGKIYEGGNIESSSYSLTICAERTAVFKAILEGEREFESIAIASDAEEFCPPCGACRQVLLDLCGKDLNVILINPKEEIKKFKLSELIPHSFGEDFLK